MKRKHTRQVSQQFKKRPIVILVWGDSPSSVTGFATVIKNIFTPLAKSGDYDIDIVGINDRGEWKDPSKYPFRVYPARNPLDPNDDFHGRPKLMAAVAGKEPDLKPPWDIIFTLNDPFIMEEVMMGVNQNTMAVLKAFQKLYKEKADPKLHYKIVSYWPVDSPVKGNWVEKVISQPDKSVAYTDYAVQEIDKGDLELTTKTEVAKNMPVIYHGINHKDFFPLPAEERKAFREEYYHGRVKDDTFLVVSVARNQQRKDIPRTMQIFAEFHKRRPNSFLYIHAQEMDAWGSLKEHARNYHLELGKDWGFPSKFSSNVGFPVDIVNMIYNSADCVISTSLGEGFGLYNFEAMATKVPILAPNNTVHPELFGYDAKEDISDMNTLYQKVRGIPMKSGATLSEWALYGPIDMTRPRPLVNVDDGVKKLLWIYNNPDKVQEITDRAHQWVQQYTWESVVKQWDKLFREIFEELEDERKIAQVDYDKRVKAESLERKPAE